MPRGGLRVYLGAAPGVGKTFNMLAEGQRRASRGTDVVIGYMEDYGRLPTRRMADGLETIPRKTVTYRGMSFAEMDLDAVLARDPGLALVDELAHTDVPGCRNEKRWQDVEELLDAGIDVMTTVNIQHLESLNDVIERITGVRQRETIPDDVVRRADQIELVDMSAEALRRRMIDGNVYPPDKIEPALHSYFRSGNLTALRELAMLWAADRVDEALLRYRDSHGIHQPWAARERVLVALSGGPEGDTLVRRAKRIAARGAGGEFHAVHVEPQSGLDATPPEPLAHQRGLVEALGGTFHRVIGDDPAPAVLELARDLNATQIVVGATRRGRLKALFSHGVGEQIIHGSGDDIDVYVVTHAEAAYRKGR
ncbi:universal stress protein [Yinghuangia sp. ASG 101]|uniref:universal stress protein n=1 Tax=Yinghuangia sp. ASG 101 TaxID=2896848 RepID=UPI001E56F7CE|nr:universal stress protein [Yinghuangia sp. ASG 101]UGQ11335.1 universal stress protein [Yinghuangia sp. ASG 101]